MKENIISVPDGYIQDFIDETFRLDTPEEYVRQNIEKRLVNEHKFFRNQITVEMPIKVGSGNKRIDLAVFDENIEKKQENISIIIETKREEVEYTNRAEGIEQLKSYMAACLNCEWGMWTNEKSKFVFRKLKDNKNKLFFEEVNDIPSKGRDISEIDKPSRDSLKLATEDNMLYAFKTCHNHIYVNDGLQKSQAFFELLKVIFCKILDERNIPNQLQFYASSSEKLSLDGQLTVHNRISKIYEKVKKKYPNIFDSSDEIKLKPVSLAYIISELQKYSLLDTYIDVKGKAYEEIVGSNLRGDRGEFFTPRNITRMVVKMLGISLEEKVLDVACGTGGFLVIGMNNVITRLKKDMINMLKKPESKWTESEKGQMHEKVSEIASANFFGFDINPDLVKATKMNMVMNNDGSGNILHTDSLKPPHEWSTDFKDKIQEKFNLEKNSLRNKDNLALFDVVITNPPFGTKLPIKDPNVLEQFDLGHKWKKNKETNTMIQTSELVTSRAPEVLFIERCWQFLRHGGRMGIVLPNAILGAPGLADVREWILKNCKIIASVSLHPDTFQPRNGTQTSVLILQKKTPEEIEISDDKLNYDIFFGIIDKIGHDKRGNPIFKRDNDGNELLVIEKEKQDVNLTENNNKEMYIQKKILDDQSDSLATVFLEWKNKKGTKWKQ